MGPRAPLGGLYRSIQLLHLDEPLVKNFICNLTDCQSCPLGHGHKSPLDVRYEDLSLPDSGSKVNGLEQPLDRKPKKALWRTVRKQIMILSICLFRRIRDIIVHPRTVAKLSGIS